MRRLKLAAPAAMLVALLWIVRFWHSGEFGLYEDDLTHLPTAAEMSLGQAATFAFDPARVLRLEGQGHPLHFTFIFLLGNLGWSLGGLAGAYGVGFAVEALNVILFFVLLRKVHSWQLGLTGGLAYVLYSADTTQAFLTHALGLHPALTFLLLACLAYVSGRRWVAYLLSPLVLLTYETVYPVLFALPLLMARSRRERIRELLLHTAILATILLAFIGWRIQAGDDRLGGLAARDALVIPVLHMVQGPVVSLGTHVYRPLQAVLAIDAEVGVAAALGFAVFVVLLARLRLGAPEGLRNLFGLELAAARRGGRLRGAIGDAYRRLPPELAGLLRLLGAGAVMLVLAYPLTFTVRAYAISGRETRVHAAGVVGAAILVGSLVLLAMWVAEAYSRRRWAALGFGVWFGLLAAYGFVLQRDYRLAWQLQREFWSELLPQIDDASEGTVIMVDPEGLVDSLQIGANTWNLPRVLEQLRRLPQDWSRPPRVFRGLADWREYLILPDGSLRINGDTTMSPEGTHTTTDWAHLIVIETEEGVQRRLRPLIIDAEPYPLAEPGAAVLSQVPATPLYDLLVRPTTGASGE